MNGGRNCRFYSDVTESVRLCAIKPFRESLTVKQKLFTDVNKMYNYTTLKMQIILTGKTQKCQITDIFIQVFRNLGKTLNTNSRNLHFRNEKKTGVFTTRHAVAKSGTDRRNYSHTGTFNFSNQLLLEDSLHRR